VEYPVLIGPVSRMGGEPGEWDVGERVSEVETDYMVTKTIVLDPATAKVSGHDNIGAALQKLGSREDERIARVASLRAWVVFHSGLLWVYEHFTVFLDADIYEKKSKSRSDEKKTRGGGSKRRPRR
jgi:hypothetical protein